MVNLADTLLYFLFRGYISHFNLTKVVNYHTKKLIRPTSALFSLNNKTVQVYHYTRTATKNIVGL